MPELLTMQDLANGHLDVKALGEAANGDENKQVITRTGETYPSAKKAIKQMFENGGLPATPFATKALMTASALVDGQYAMVTDDTVNNGLYVKTAGAWVKSAYDPLTVAKADATVKADAALAAAKTYSNKTSEHIGSNLLDSNQDIDGNIYAYTEKDGNKHLSGLDGSIQDNFASVNARVSYNPSGSDAAQVLDKNGELMLGLTADSTLLVNDLVTSQGSINDFMLNGKSGETANVNLGEVYKNLDGYHSAKDEPINEIHTLADAVDFAGYFSNFAPDIVQIGKNQFYLVFELRDTGDDYGEMKIMGRKLTYSPATRAIELGDYVEIATNGDTETGVPYVYINACVTYVERGNHAGRIYVHCNYMTNPTVADDRVYKPYYMYSDDGGVSFTAPISMASMIPDYDVNMLWVASPAHGIQLNHGEFKDRLVITAYTIHPDAPVDSLGWGALALVSDDGGDTWQRGAYLDIVGLNETQVAELPDGRVAIVARHYSWRDYAYIAYSSDGGLTFDSPKLIDGVLGAGTKKGLASCDNSFNYALPKLVLVSASDETGSAEGRVNPCIWASYDGGETWTDKKQIAVGICQYTDVVPLDEDHVLVVWGGGTLRDGDKILASVVNTKFIIGRT